MPRVLLLGHGFMGRAHAHAYNAAPEFFDLTERPELSLVYGRDTNSLRSFASHFGFKGIASELEKALSSSSYDILDNCLPNHLHANPTIAALNNGKSVLVEKPMALNVEEAQEMVKAYERAGKGVKAMVGFNYRFLPAIALAKQLINEGKIGNVTEFRAAYLHESLARPNATAGWRQQREYAGTGALGDLGSHVIDMARYLVGEIKDVVAKLDVHRPELASSTGEKLKVTVDDAFRSLVNFTGGATGVIEASKVAPGMRNSFRFDVHGEKGTISFNLERPNELQLFSFGEDFSVQGFNTILAAGPSYPYSGGFWPEGHVLGWEHSVMIEVAHFVKSVEEDLSVEPGASLRDGLAVQKVIEAMQRSSEIGAWIPVH